MRGLTLGCACPTDSLKRQLCFAVCGYLLYLFCMQPNSRYRLFCYRTAGRPLRAELCRRTGLCWRTWSLGERIPYLCKSDGCVCVHAVCNWQCILCALERHFHYSQVLCILSVDDRVSLDGRLLLRTGLRWSTQ